MVTFNPKYDASCVQYTLNNLHDGGAGFCRAAKSGDLRLEKYIQKHQGEICYSHPTTKELPLLGATPLHYAAESSQVELARILIDNGYNIDRGTPSLYTPLYLAAQKGKTDMVKFLIQKGAHVNALSAKDGMPLHAATKECHVEVAKLLIENGADVNARDKSGYKPLHWAIEKGCKEIKELLIKHTDIYSAVEQGYQEIVESLIKHGADVNAKDKSGYTSLHWAKDVGMVNLLIGNGADINAKDNNGYTPLHWAARNGHQDILEALIEHKADMSVKDKYGYTPLHCATHVGMVDFLIKHGADVNAQDNNGYTTLHWAAKQGHKEIVELLIKYNADIVKAKDGKLPSELATDKLLHLEVKNYEQAKEIERIKKQTDAEKEAEAKAQKEKEEAEEAKKAALEKELKETEEKLKEVTDEKTTALEKLLKLQKDMRELEKEQPVIEKVLLDVKEEFNKCNLAQKLETITNKLEEIEKDMPEIAAYYSTDQSRFENVINNILSNAELLNDNKMKSNIVTTVKEMLDMLKKCGSQSEEKLYLITDKIDDIKENMPQTSDIDIDEIFGKNSEESSFYQYPAIDHYGPAI